MIGLLFHGPEVFDSGWAEKIINAIKSRYPVCCVLAGTMGRTAAFDAGIKDIEFRDQMPGVCLSDLAIQTEATLIVNYGKSEEAGQVFGAMVVKRSGVKTPVIQIECSGPFFVEWVAGCNPGIIDILRQINIPKKNKIQLRPSVWESGRTVCRRMSTASPGDFILVNGIMVGRATDAEVILECRDGHICKIQGAAVKEHGIEKLDRFGGIDLATAKLASSPNIRRTNCSPNVIRTNGSGMVFLDHSGMHVYELIGEAEGAVTVGDDTTAVAGDILARFQIPVIGIVDGDEDMILQNGHLAKGSVKLKVSEDDVFGLEVFGKIFGCKQHISMGFPEALERIRQLAAPYIVDQQFF